MTTLSISTFAGFFFFGLVECAFLGKQPVPEMIHSRYIQAPQPYQQGPPPLDSVCEPCVAKAPKCGLPDTGICEGAKEGYSSCEGFSKDNVTTYLKNVNGVCVMQHPDFARDPAKFTYMNDESACYPMITLFCKNGKWQYWKANWDHKDKCTHDYKCEGVFFALGPLSKPASCSNCTVTTTQATTMASD